MSGGSPTEREEETLLDIAKDIKAFYRKVPSSSRGVTFFIPSSLDLGERYATFLRERYRGFPDLTVSALTVGGTPWTRFIRKLERQLSVDFKTGEVR